ncbi:WD40-repeat-containing domain protein [Trichoderma pleuroticola]
MALFHWGVAGISGFVRPELYKKASTQLLSRGITSNPERTCILQDELLEVPDHPEDELLEVPDYPEDELQKVPDYPEDELPEVPYSLEDPLKEVSILVNNLYALSDAFCRQLLSQPLCSEDKRHIIRDCLTAFSTLENKLVASVPGYYLENPLNDSLRDLVGCIVSFCDFKRLEEIWARGKAKVSRNVADDHDIYSRFATRLREMKKLRDESKKRLHLAKTIKPEQFEGNNDGGSRDTSFDDLGKTLRKFSEANTNTTTYVILDGLDKYDNEDLTRLFELISTTINSSPKIHWILSIRSFENSTAIKGISYTLANVGDNKKLKDVAYKFVSMQVDTFFKRTGCRDTSRNYFKYKLSEGWRGNLLWITLACCTIEKHPKGALHLSHLEEKDERLKIESLYAYIYIQLHLTTEEKKYFGEIVTTLTAAYRPLTICELRLLVPPIDAVDLEDMIKRRLLFFLEVQDGLVCFGHELAKKYLVKKYAGRNKTLLIQAKEDIPHDCIIADIIDALRFLRFNHDLGDARPMDSLLFYPYEEFKLKLLKGFFPQLLNKPATEYKRKDMTLNLHSQSGVLACAYSPDGHFLASTSKCDKSVSIWDVYTGRKISQLKTQALDGFNLSCIAFSVSGALAVLTSLNTIDVWDFPTRKIIKTIRKVLASPSNEDADFWNLTFSPDGKQLATTNGKSMLTWALPSFEEHRHQINTPDTISRVKFLGDGLIAFSSSNIITLWREETEENVHIFRGHKERITNLEFLPKHQWLASASRNESVIRLWDPNSGLELYTLDSHNSGIGSISFSFDETKLASGSKDAIEIWDLENIGSDPQGPNVRRIENFKDSKHVELVVFSPKDLSLASALRGGPTWIWDTCAFRHEVKGSVTQTVKHTSAIQCLKFSHNGEFFATADRDGKICIWDGKTGDYTISLESKGCKLHSISPDDQSLVTSSADGAMAIWNTGNWLLRRKLVGHRDKVLCVEFSPDGKHMASASHDGTIGIWDLLNEYEFAAMKPAHQIKVELELETLDKSRNIFQRGNAIRACMAFSPDGTQLACSVRGGAAVQIWKVKPDGSLDAPQQLHFATDASAKRIFFSQDANFIIASGYEHLGIWGFTADGWIIF